MTQPTQSHNHTITADLALFRIPTSPVAASRQRPPVLCRLVTQPLSAPHESAIKPLIKQTGGGFFGPRWLSLSLSLSLCSPCVFSTCLSWLGLRLHESIDGNDRHGQVRPRVRDQPPLASSNRRASAGGPLLDPPPPGSWRVVNHQSTTRGKTKRGPSQG